MLWLSLDVSTLEYCLLSSSLQGLRCVLFYCITIPKEMKKKRMFWNDLNRALDRLHFMGDLSGRIEDSKREDIADIFRVPGENKDGSIVVDLRVQAILISRK